MGKLHYYKKNFASIGRGYGQIIESNSDFRFSKRLLQHHPHNQWIPGVTRITNEPSLIMSAPFGSRVILQVSPSSHGLLSVNNYNLFDLARRRYGLDIVGVHIDYSKDQTVTRDVIDRFIPLLNEIGFSGNTNELWLGFGTTRSNCDLRNLGYNVYLVV